jgi:hypothetical protein
MFRPKSAKTVSIIGVILLIVFIKVAFDWSQAPAPLRHYQELAMTDLETQEPTTMTKKLQETTTTPQTTQEPTTMTQKLQEPTTTPQTTQKPTTTTQKLQETTTTPKTTQKPTTTTQKLQETTTTPQTTQKPTTTTQKLQETTTTPKTTQKPTTTTQKLQETTTTPRTTQESTSTVSTTTLRYSMIDDGKLAKRNDSFIYMLFFNKFQIYDDSWGLGKETSSPEDLAKVKCPYINCIFTRNKTLLPNVHDFDVVFLTVWWQQVMDVPKTRHPKQFYVLSINE